MTSFSIFFDKFRNMKNSFTGIMRLSIQTNNPSFSNIALEFTSFKVVS